jgi:hypothetical protein
MTDQAPEQGPAEEWTEVGGRFTALVDAVPAGAWDAPAPVGGWVARSRDPGWVGTSTA